MTSSGSDKALIAAGLAGAGIVAWQSLFPWIKYDLQLLKIGVQVAAQLNKMTQFLIDAFESHVLKHPNKPMIIFEDRIYSWQMIDQQANRVANVMLQQGAKFGDTVAMMIDNEPAFIWTLLGLQKLGITVSQINVNLTHRPLSHSIIVCEPQYIIIGSGKSLHNAVSDVLEELQGIPVYLQGLHHNQPPTGVLDFDFLMASVLPVAPHPSIREQMTETSTLCYIYTSGTTGLPKPAYLSQMKAKSIPALMLIVDFKADDILYTTLPLYHSSGGAIGLYSLISRGATMVLRRKFSAKNFWSDCRKYNVTVIQYIGELFRYILSQPPDALDSVHKVRGAVGNGLQRDTWEAVKTRFKIPVICEFFGASEGLSMLWSVADKPGAVGRISPLLSKISPLENRLVKFDYETALPVRNKNGRCTPIKPGEVGLFISKVPEKSKINLNVYKATKEVNEKKFIRNAFVDGDIYMNYGDVLYLDKDYFVYFHDRIGDTFRWKGENVSTAEVASIIVLADFILDANVYGVRIPGHDGRAGMVAITFKEGQTLSPEKLQWLYKICEDNLPSYARPLFVRVLSESVLTGTYKLRKVDLVIEGYDLAIISDPLFYLDTKAQTYLPLTSETLIKFLQSKL